MITPNSRVYLLSDIPLSNNYKNQVTFSNVNEQTNYFQSKAMFSHDDFTYVRSEGYIRIPANADKLYSVNYIMFQNENYSDKWFYAFVTKREYVNANMTNLHIELDVFQTWQFDIELTPCFVEREHRTDPPLLDEGLDYGSDMHTVYFKQVLPYSDLKWLVVVSKSAMHTDDNSILGSVIGVPQPLCYYVLPFKKDGTIVNASTGDGGTNMTVIDALSKMYKNDNAINNVVSLYITDDIGMYYTYDGSVVTFADGTSQETSVVTVNSGENSVALVYIKKLLTFKTTETTVETKEQGLTQYSEKKLMQYPYTQCILTDFKGNAFNVKLEMINGTHIILETRGSLGLSNKTSVNIKNYNVDYNLTNMADFEYGFINSDPQDVSIISDNLSAYLQGNRNSLNNQVSQAQFNSLMDLGNVVTNIGGNVSGGGGAIATANAVSSGVSTIGNNYYNLKSFSAKQKDISNVPPNLVKQGSNVGFTYGNSFDGYYIIKKQLKQEYANRLTMFFKMFGYQVNEVKKPNLKTKSTFNYVKTQNCILKGRIPHEDMLILENIFDSGVTLWHNPAWVGDYDRANS